MLGKWLFQIAKSPLTGTLVGMGFEYCSRLLPVRKLFCSKEVLAFWHPQPSYQNHLIITPRKAIRNLQQMADNRFSGYFAEIWEAVRSIQATQPAFQNSFVLIANGGKRQEVQQVHFHLFTHCSLIRESAADFSHGTLICRDDVLDVMEPPNPEWELHFVCIPAQCQADPSVYFQKVLHTIQYLDNQFRITEKGYSLIFQSDSETAHMDHPVFHIVSGKKRS